MSFWTELKRRKVVRVGAAYALAAWIVAQAAVLINEPLGLPDWFDTAVLVLLAAGFPIALVLAWAFELTPSGLRRADEVPVKTAEAAATGQRFNYVLAGLLVGAIVGSGAVWLYADDSDGWALDTAIADIQAAAGAGDTLAAYYLALDAERRAPGSQALATIWPSISVRMSIPSEPSGATVSWRPYDSSADAWRPLGTTPIADVRLPATYLRLKFELDGHRALERTFQGWVPPPYEDALVDASVSLLPPPPRSNAIRLSTPAGLAEDMIRVSGWEETIEGSALRFEDYFLERFEVTNREFKEFVDAGGYETERYWQHPFIRGGEDIGWQQAMQSFTDRSGRPGPSTWLGGDYPEGQDDFPVAGVSWFEAAAFAVFAGRELPSVYHWRRAINSWNSGWLLPASNLQAGGPRPVGEAPGMTWAGAYDMGGNVREWVFNAFGEQRFILGGAWNENLFSGLILDAADNPFDRSETNGFRLALTRDNSEVMALARQPVSVPARRDLSEFEPAPDGTLDLFARQYDYDRTPLNAVHEESRDERNWTRERVVVDAAYGNDRMPIYLYLPKSARPPYQTVVFFPGAFMFFQSSVDQSRFALDFVVDNGRAVVLPIYNGTYDRVDDMGPEPGFDTIAGRDRWIEMNQDMRRAIDYLETRSDIDMNALAYFGFSWGGQIAPNNLALEPRLKTAVLALAGVLLTNHFLPEIDPMNFTGRVSVPVLMLSATYDNIFPLETSAVPFFEALGTPESDKQQVIFESGHDVPDEILVSRTLEWLDRYLGPVE